MPFVFFMAVISGFLPALPLIFLHVIFFLMPRRRYRECYVFSCHWIIERNFWVLLLFPTFVINLLMRNLIVPLPSCLRQQHIPLWRTVATFFALPLIDQILDAADKVMTYPVGFFHVPWHMFLNLARLLKNCPSFSSEVRQLKHLSHKLHLLGTLKYFGSAGNASSFSHAQGGLGIRKGSVLNCIERTVTALWSFQKRSIFWPSAAERQESSQQFKDEYFFKVVGTVVGTHLGLVTKPSL